MSVMFSGFPAKPHPPTAAKHNTLGNQRREMMVDYLIRLSGFGFIVGGAFAAEYFLKLDATLIIASAALWSTVSGWDQ